MQHSSWVHLGPRTNPIHTERLLAVMQQDSDIQKIHLAQIGAMESGWCLTYSENVHDFVSWGYYSQ